MYNTCRHFCVYCYANTSKECVLRNAEKHDENSESIIDWFMLEHELQQYLLREYPQENARCEWKEFKNLKNSFCGDEKNDVISYVSSIANIELNSWL